MATWTFDNIPFTWLRQEENGVPIEPDWQREPREVIRPLLGTGDADIARIGYMPQAISGPITVKASATATAAQNAVALKARSGETALISDGTTVWMAYGKITPLAKVVGDDSYTGKATFTRARAL